MAANKHQQKSEATRRKLLDAALRIFARDGFEAARLEDIAKESGHTRGAFYANFDTKEDLFFALLEQQATERLEQLRRLLEKNENMEARLETLRSFYLASAKDRQKILLTLEFKLFALRRPKVRARLVGAYRRIRASLNYDELKKLMPFSPDDEIDKLLFEVVLMGLVLEHAYNPKRVSAQQMMETLGRAFDWLIPPARVAKR